MGRVPGRVVEPIGKTTFGWDPVFLPDGFDQTYAELDKSVKNTISHRYTAHICGSVSNAHDTSVKDPSTIQTNLWKPV